MIRFHQILHNKTHKNSHENDDFNLKIVNFDHFCKKNRLAASPLPGVTLGGEQSPATRCAGAKTCRKTPDFEKHFSVVDRSSPTIPETHP